VAQAAFASGNPYLTFRDTLGTIYQDDDFPALFPACGQPGLPPWRLALVTMMQFREPLSDRPGALASRRGHALAAAELAPRAKWRRGARKVRLDFLSVLPPTQCDAPHRDAADGQKFAGDDHR
jgi:hypothetical protein